MFQVQTQPASPFTLPMERAVHHAPSPAINLPRSLQRPEFREVDKNRVNALAPELADVPLEYIRKHLASQANEYVASAFSYCIRHADTLRHNLLA